MLTESKQIALTHAGGLRAEALLETLANEGVSRDHLLLLDIPDRAGKRLAYGDSYLSLQDQYQHDYENLLAVFLLEADSELESLLQHADCPVFSHDFSATLKCRYLYEINQQELPRDSAMVCLAPDWLATSLPVLRQIDQFYELESVTLVKVVSAASKGRPGVDELASQTISLLNSRPVESSLFPLQLAFNMIPQQSGPDAQRVLRQALSADELSCSVQCILAPVFHGLAMAFSLRTRQAMDIETVSGQLGDLKNYQLSSEPVSPLTHCKSGLEGFVYDLSQEINDSNRVQFWIVADSFKNGLIQNYLNILEILLKSYL